MENGKYRVAGVVDISRPELREMQERELRRRLLLNLAEILCSGKNVRIKITRDEEKDTRTPFRVKNYVTYTADLDAVQEIPLVINPEPYRKATGRNHRKKDRARARMARARHRKLLERLSK